MLSFTINNLPYLIPTLIGLAVLFSKNVIARLSACILMTAHVCLEYNLSSHKLSLLILWMLIGARFILQRESLLQFAPLLLMIFGFFQDNFFLSQMYISIGFIYLWTNSRRIPFINILVFIICSLLFLLLLNEFESGQALFLNLGPYFMATAFLWFYMINKAFLEITISWTQHYLLLLFMLFAINIKVYFIIASVIPSFSFNLSGDFFNFYPILVTLIALFLLFTSKRIWTAPDKIVANLAIFFVYFLMLKVFSEENPNQFYLERYLIILFFILYLRENIYSLFKRFLPNFNHYFDLLTTTFVFLWLILSGFFSIKFLRLSPAHIYNSSLVILIPVILMYNTVMREIFLFHEKISFKNK